MNATAWSILLAAVLTNNILLTNFLGVCPYSAWSRRIKTAVALGLAVLIASTCTALLNHLVYQALAAAGLGHMHLLAFVAVIAAFVQAAGMVAGRWWPAASMMAPMVTINCAVLGVSLFVVARGYTLVQAAAFGAGGGAGWAMAIVLMAGLQQKMAYSDVPRPFRGLAIALIVTGVMAMALAGFVGLAAIE